MKDINEAYDALTKKRSSTGPGAGGYGYSGQASGGTYQTTPEFAKIRQIINAGDLDAADRMLEGITDRGAEWYFLRGNIAQRRGWMDEAHRNFRPPARWPPATSNTVRPCPWSSTAATGSTSPATTAPATAPTTPALSAR